MGATSIIQPIDMVKVRLQLGATGGPVSGAVFLQGINMCLWYGPQQHVGFLGLLVDTWQLGAIGGPVSGAGCSSWALAL
jgi:hypothetical protein